VRRTRIEAGGSDRGRRLRRSGGSDRGRRRRSSPEKDDPVAREREAELPHNGGAD
jgi:hypothetical protein